MPLLFNDAMWAKYDLGTATKTNDSKTGKPATRNIYYQQVDANGNPAADDKPHPGRDPHADRGVCDPPGAGSRL